MNIRTLYCIAIIGAAFLITSCKDEKSVNQPQETPIVTPEEITPPIEPHYPIPTQAQIEWQEAELTMFVHYGINTYTDVEWGDGTEDPKIFNPPGDINTDQWISIAKETGFKYVILTTKHHDGFCLWPSKLTEHSVKNSRYQGGKGDVVKQFANSCQKFGVRAGFYLSPWDRHESTFGTNAYNLHYQAQLTELMRNYGKVYEVWFDGVNGDSTKRQVYNWDLFFSTVRTFQPYALTAIWGEDIRWVGNESGYGDETQWSPGWSLKGYCWFPAECDVSIRPGWFYHDYEDQSVKSVDSLVNLYFLSVGRNTNLLLNVPPNRAGVFSNKDIEALRFT